jgi:hypothetical protein
MRQPVPDAQNSLHPPSGGRSSWAHFEFTGISITPTILRKKIEEKPDVL